MLFFYAFSKTVLVFSMFFSRFLMVLDGFENGLLGLTGQVPSWGSVNTGVSTHSELPNVLFKDTNEGSGGRRKQSRVLLSQFP